MLSFETVARIFCFILGPTLIEFIFERKSLSIPNTDEGSLLCASPTSLLIHDPYQSCDQ